MSSLGLPLLNGFIGELADARIQKTFSPQEAEALEEISEVEVISEPYPSPPPEAPAERARGIEVEMEATSLRKAEAPRPAPVEYREVGEIEVEVPEPSPPPPPAADFNSHPRNDTLLPS